MQLRLMALIILPAGLCAMDAKMNEVPPAYEGDDHVLQVVNSGDPERMCAAARVLMGAQDVCAPERIATFLLCADATSGDNKARDLLAWWMTNYVGAFFGGQVKRAYVQRLKSCDDKDPSRQLLGELVRNQTGTLSGHLKTGCAFLLGEKVPADRLRALAAFMLAHARFPEHPRPSAALSSLFMDRVIAVWKGYPDLPVEHCIAPSPNRALHYAQRGLIRAPRHPLLLAEAAEAHLLKGDREGAHDLFKKALAAHNSSAPKERLANSELDDVQSHIRRTGPTICTIL